MPAELNQSLPRRTKVRTKFRVCTVLLLGYPIYALAMSGWIYYPAFRDFQNIRERGVATQATIYDLRTAQASWPTRYYVDYAFEPRNDGKTIRGWDLTTAERFDRLRTGAAVPIVYDRVDPTNSELNFANEALARGPLAATLRTIYAPSLAFVAFCCALLAVAAFLLIAVYRRERRLVRWGRPTMGTSAVAKTLVGPAVVYEFSDERGNVRSCRPGLVTRSGRVPLIAPNGESARTVLYDPDDSSICVVYPAQYVDCVVE